MEISLWDSVFTFLKIPDSDEMSCKTKCAAYNSIQQAKRRGYGVLSKYSAADMASLCFVTRNRGVIVCAPSAGSRWYCRTTFHSGTLGTQLKSVTGKVMLHLHLICLSLEKKIHPRY